MKSTKRARDDLSIIRHRWPFTASYSHTGAALLCLLNRHAQDNAQPISAELTWKDSLASTVNETQAIKLTIPVQFEEKPTLAAYLNCVSTLNVANHGHQFLIYSGTQNLDINELDSRFNQLMLLPHFSLEVHSSSSLFTASYNGEYYDHRLIQHLCSQFQHLVEQFSALPASCEVADLSFCSPFDRNRILEWNSCPPPCVEDVVTAKFDLQVRRQPSAPAISSWDGDFSYQEVQELSIRLAHCIQELAPGIEQIIPLCFNKSAAAIITMLAVLRAGCACANISPAQPVDRQQRIYDICESNIILCSPSLAQRMRQIAPESCIVLAIDVAAIAALPPSVALPSKQLPLIEPISLAYILFTSGTTGTPKAIAVEHGSLCTSAEAHGTKWRIGPGTRVLQFAAYSFDVSVADVFFSLTRGACICSPSETERLDDLAGAAKRMRANWAYLTCSMAAAISPASMPGIDFLLVGGEAPTQRMIQDWAQHTDLVVSTGPAECTIHCMGSNPVASNADPRNVGRAIGGRLWVTEPNDPTKLAPFGAVGELVVEGRIVSRGYLKESQRTADSFITEPPYLPASEKGTGSKTRRLYRSGDLVQYAMDGTLRMMGRRDDQVKVRGQRVDLAEVEAHLKRAAPWAKSIKVLLVKAENSDGLVAFFSIDLDGNTHQAAKAVGWEQAQAWLDARPQLIPTVMEDIKQRVPSYMIPQCIIPINKMPTTLNGKLDNKSLHDLHRLVMQTRARSVLEVTTVPMSSGEAQMARIWSRVLCVDEQSINRESDFFCLGGDSLSAIRLVAHARSVGITLGFALLSRHPKLKELAQVAMADASATDALILPPVGSLLPGVSSNFSHLRLSYAEQCAVQGDLIEDAYPCTPMQEGLMSLSLRHPGTYTTRTVWRCTPNLDKERFRRAWRDVYAANDILHTRIVIDDNTGSLVQVVVKEPLHWGSVMDASQKTSPEFSLGEPLLRCAFVSDHVSATSHRFVLEMHHAIYDGFSMTNLLDQVRRVYNDQEPATAIPFKAFVAYWQTLNQSAAKAFWKAQLDGFEVSACYLNGTASSTMSTEPSQYKANLRRSNLSCSMKHTLATIITGSFASTLRSHLSSDDICFGSTTSGRHASLSSISEIMGPTLATFPLRIRQTPAQWQSSDNLLAQIRKLLADTIPYEQYGMQNIRSLGPGQAAACSFDTMLIVQALQRASTRSQFFGDEEHSCEVVQELGLLVECTPTETDIQICATFHPTKLSTKEIKIFLASLCTNIINFSSE